MGTQLYGCGVNRPAEVRGPFGAGLVDWRVFGVILQVTFALLRRGPAGRILVFGLIEAILSEGASFQC